MRAVHTARCELRCGGEGHDRLSFPGEKIRSRVATRKHRRPRRQLLALLLGAATTIPKHRTPTAPGEILFEEFLNPLGMTQMALAETMGVPIQRVNTLGNGKRGATAETAILLSEALGTTPEFWMTLQVSFDLWHARKAMKKAG